MLKDYITKRNEESVTQVAGIYHVDGAEYNVDENKIKSFNQETAIGLLSEIEKMVEGMECRCKCGSTNFKYGYEGEAHCVDCEGENGNDVEITSTSIGYNQALSDLLKELREGNKN